MKRSFALILALVFILTAILVSCESSEVEKEEEKEKGTAAIDKNVEVIVDGNDNVVFDFFDLDEESEAKE